MISISDNVNIETARFQAMFVLTWLGTLSHEMENTMSDVSSLRNELQRTVCRQHMQFILENLSKFFWLKPRVC